MTAELKTVYQDNTSVSHSELGVTISCSKGMWSVTAPTVEQAHREAGHYFLQYHADGEYHEGYPAVSDIRGFYNTNP